MLVPFTDERVHRDDDNDEESELPCREHDDVEGQGGNSGPLLRMRGQPTPHAHANYGIIRGR